jgi:hypothetical protein
MSDECPEDRRLNQGLNRDHGTIESAHPVHRISIGCGIHIELVKHNHRLLKYSLKGGHKRMVSHCIQICFESKKWLVRRAYPAYVTSYVSVLLPDHSESITLHLLVHRTLIL